MIDNLADLQRLVDDACNQSVVALDTEFVRERTYYAKLGVVQLGWSEDDCFLIDAIAIEDLSPLAELLVSDEVTKVFHDPEQDLEILHRSTSVLPRRVFDSRTAAGFSGLGATISLRDLVAAITGVSLAKTETRTDWTRRPLTERQIDYCLDDVRRLPTVHAELVARADKLGRCAWIEEEMAVWQNPRICLERDPYEMFRRVRGANGFSLRDFAVLRELTAWRETEARSSDRNRARVLTDKSLVTLAKRKPKSMDKLKHIRELNDADLRRCGKQILDAIGTGMDIPEEDCPRPIRKPEDDDGFTARVDLVLACLRGRGVAEQLDPSLLGTRADVEALVRAGAQATADDHPLLRGWRCDFIGADILGLLTGERDVRIDPATGCPDLTRS